MKQANSIKLDNSLDIRYLLRIKCSFIKKNNLSLHPIDIFRLKLAFLVLKNKLFRCLQSIFVTSLSSPFVKGHGSLF